MSSTTASTSVPSDPTEETATVRLKQDIEHTREDLSETIAALEDKLSPSQIREVVGAELQQVEGRVRTVLDEQLTNAKAAVHEEVEEAKTLLREGMRDAERLVKTGLSDARESLTIGLSQAKESVKQELKDAMNGASESIRAATLGKIENFATAVGDKMNDARDTLFDTIYKNPLPATVTGVGLLWLLMNRSRAASERRSDGSNGGGAIGQVGTAVGRAAQQASGAVAQGLHGASSAAGDALDSASGVVTGVAQSATQGAGQAVQTVSEGASALAENARHGAKRVEQTVQRTIHDRPLAVGAGALAVGTMVACLLPHTEAEDQLMGGTRDRLLYRAGDAVHEAAGSMTELAEKALPVDKGTAKQGDGAHDESGART
jgi:hypothetical protein